MRSYRVLLASAGMLTGCAQFVALEEKVNHGTQTAQQAIRQVSNPFPSAGLVKIDRPLIGLTEVAAASKPLPPIFEQEVSFTSFGSQTLPEILETLSRMTGLSIEARDVLQSEQHPSAQPPQASPSLLQQTLSYRFQGKLRWLFDDLAARLGASWRFNHASRLVVFYRYEARTFAVMLPMGKKSINASISIGGEGGGAGGGGGGGAGGGGGGGAGGSVSIQSDMGIDPWSSLMDGVRVFLGQGATQAQAAGGASAGGSSAMLVSGRDGYAVGNRDLAELIVVARPWVMERIAQMVEQTNRRFARNVLIDVRVLEIQVSRNDAVGISASALLQKALATTGLTQFDVQLVGGPIPMPGQASQLTITAAASSAQVQLNVDTIVQALASVSSVAVRNQGQIVAINGQPAPFQQANQVSYLASIQTTQVPNVGTQTSVQPGTVTVGFTANFIPTIMADNRIMLQYQLQSNSLLGLRTVGPQNSQIQVPEIYTQSLQQQAYVRDGDVIVLFGFEQERSQLNDTNSLWTQGRSGQSNQVMTAVIIQVRAAKEVLS